MAQLDVITQGLAPGMWAVVSRVITWEWIESTGRVRWQVETILPPHVIRSAIPSVVSVEVARPGDRDVAKPESPVRKRASKKRSEPVSAAA